MFDQKIVNQVKKFIEARVSDRDDAEEIWQETLTSAYKSMPNFGGYSSFSSWLCGIAKHETADFYRKKKIKTVLFSHLPFLEELADQALGPQEQVLEEELKLKIKSSFKKISEGYQVVLRLKYIDGLSVSQIARRLDLTVKAVESRLSRARFAFREAWTTEDVQISDVKYQRSKSKKGKFLQNSS
ncbi:MAG: RNA polymerase sigma factor [bacterium]|nr:RNA polymerase sigma factor [bacterium]